MRYKTAVVIAVWTETALWVIFFLLYVICVRVLTRKRTRETIQWIPLFSASLLFLLATTHISFQLRKLYEGLVLCAKEKGGPDAYFMNLARWLNVAADGIYATMILVGDSVVIHRCYLIWGRRLHVIIIPALLLLGTGASSYFAVWLFTQLPPTGTALEGRLAQCTKATFLLSLATNLSTTVLIAYRIISTARKVSSTIDVRPYMTGLTIIIESAAMYTTALVIYMIIYVLRTNAQYIMFCALCPIIGIVPTLIIVRVGLGLTNTTQIEVSPPTPTSPTFDVYPPTNTDTPHHITPVMPSYSPWPRCPHTRDTSGSEAAWGDTIHLELRYSQGSVGRYVTSDDTSRNSTASFGLGLVMTKTSDSKV